MSYILKVLFVYSEARPYEINNLSERAFTMGTNSNNWYSI